MAFGSLMPTAGAGAGSTANRFFLLSLGGGSRSSQPSRAYSCGAHLELKLKPKGEHHTTERRKGRTAPRPRAKSRLRWHNTQQLHNTTHRHVPQLQMRGRGGGVVVVGRTGSHKHTHKHTRGYFHTPRPRRKGYHMHMTMRELA
jgi:hypothetical protein